MQRNNNDNDNKDNDNEDNSRNLLYYRAVFLNCISQLYFSNVLQTQPDAVGAGMQLHEVGRGESIALGVNLQTALNTVNVTPSAINRALHCVSW